MKSVRSSESAASEVRTHPSFDAELRKFAKRNPVDAERLLKGMRRFVDAGVGDIERIRDTQILQRLKVSRELPRVYLARKGGITYLLGIEKRKIAYASWILEKMEKRVKESGQT